jgi:pimeloyl-ACP methyl ester carboxylesterase
MTAGWGIGLSSLFVAALLGARWWRRRDLRGITVTRWMTCAAASLLALLTLGGCAHLPDDEAGWVLEDLAAGDGSSRLKRRTPAPARLAIAYTEQGRDYRGDLYRPGQAPLAGIVLVHGVAERGKDDPRLVAFATTLARARFLVLVLDLPNLRAYRVRSGDAQAVAHAFSRLVSLPGFPAGGRAGIGALSYAVGPAVLAALRPGVRERVDFVLGIGGYYDLDQVVTFLTTSYFREHGRWRYREPSPYGKWVFVLGIAELLPDPGDRAALRRMARERLKGFRDYLYPDTGGLDGRLTAQGQALAALLENQDPERTPALIAALPAPLRTELAALNLAHQDLSRLQARLILLHGTDDNIIPHTQSVALAAAVPGTQLFLIDGLAHVNLLALGLDRRTLWRAVGALLAQRDHPEKDR